VNASGWIALSLLMNVLSVVFALSAAHSARRAGYWRARAEALARFTKAMNALPANASAEDVLVAMARVLSAPSADV
jgi:hypothetical protein